MTTRTYRIQEEQKQREEIEKELETKSPTKEEEHRTLVLEMESGDSDFVEATKYKKHMVKIVRKKVLDFMNLNVEIVKSIVVNLETKFTESGDSKIFIWY